MGLVTGMDVEWAKDQLRKFVEMTDMVRYKSPPGAVIAGVRYRADDEQIAAQAQVVEQILDRALVGWRQAAEWGVRPRKGWSKLREFAARGLEQLSREEELRSKLGDNAPTLDAGQLHPWTWEAARSLWRSGHFAEAVQAAAVRINAETQAKVGRRDISEVSLFQQAFSSEPPAPGKPRLRIPPDDGTPTAASRQRGVRALGEALFWGLRNPLAHEQQELTEHEALEHLAAFSLLARWVDESVPSLSA